MALLTFLFLSSVLYFVSSDDVPASPQLVDYQENLKGLLNTVSQGIDQYMTPMFVNFSQEDQDYLKETALKGFAGLFNYCKLIAENSQNPPALGEDDIIVELNSLANSFAYVGNSGIPSSGPVPAK